MTTLNTPTTATDLSSQILDAVDEYQVAKIKMRVAAINAAKVILVLACFVKQPKKSTVKDAIIKELLAASKHTFEAAYQAAEKLLNCHDTLNQSLYTLTAQTYYGNSVFWNAQYDSNKAFHEAWCAVHNGDWDPETIAAQLTTVADILLGDNFISL